MNHLAHALLAGSNEDVILGSLLGDFIHGPVPAGLAPGVERGLRLHRAVDMHTDAHPIVVELRAGIEPPFRRFAGILLDIWFDHLLAQDFARWCDTPLPVYSAELRALLHRRHGELPEPMQRFLVYMDRHDLPAGYAGLFQVERAITGVGTRLSRANPLAQAVPVLQAQAPRLQQGFEAFFPQLQAFARDWLAQADTTA